MKLGYEFLEEYLKSKKILIQDFCDQLNITRQALTTWKTKGVVPARRVSQIVGMFDLSSQELDRLLGNQPLHFSFRTREGQGVSDKDVSEKIKNRTEVIFERFFDQEQDFEAHDITPLQEKIRRVGEDFKEIAKLIREDFEFPSYQPVTHSIMNSIINRLKTPCFYLPFDSISLKNDGHNNQTAILFKKNGFKSILVDSDRTIDEAHFDRLHEIIHIFLDDIFEHGNELENLIDKVCGDLIYPESYLLDFVFKGDKNSRPIRDKQGLTRRFYVENKTYTYILSPKGIARAMKDNGLTSSNSELFKFLYRELQSEFRKKPVTYSKMGKMDINFSSKEAVLKFYEEIVDSKEPTTFCYPLFEKLKKDLICGAISPSDFANTFNLKTSDVIVIQAIWCNQK